MPERILRLAEADCLAPDATAARAGTLLDAGSYRLVVAESCTVYKPDGSPLLVYRRDALPTAVCGAAWGALRGAATPTDNRGLAAGKLDGAARIRAVRPDGTISGTSVSISALATNPGVNFVDSLGRPIGPQVRKPEAVVPTSPEGTRYRGRKADGTLSSTTRAGVVRSGIVGAFDRSARFPFCRLTAWTMDHPEKFAGALPFIRAVDAAFRRELPDRYAAQSATAARTAPDWLIPGTAFTTITVNKNWQTAVHQDKGDLKSGFGVMACLRAGRYTGGLLVFPRYRVAVDMRTRGVLLADVHEWHGNTPIVGRPGGFERLSCVFYYREKMQACGTAAEELQAAKRRVGGRGR